MKTFLIRGVPLAMQQDGWWMDGNTRADTRDPEAASKTPQTGRLALLIPLIALGDVLVWQVLPGLSLAVFGAAIVVAALWVAGKQISGQRFGLVAGGSVLALLPLVELVQPLSLLIAICGVSAMLALLAGLNPAELGGGALRLWPMGLRQTFDDGAHMLRHKDGAGLAALVQRMLMGWLVPITLGLVFLLLLLEANPIAQGWADAVWRIDIALPNEDRLLFWLCLLPVIWTALSLTKMRERLRAVPRAHKMGPARQGIISGIGDAGLGFVQRCLCATDRDGCDLSLWRRGPARGHYLCRICASGRLSFGDHRLAGGWICPADATLDRRQSDASRLVDVLGCPKRDAGGQFTGAP